MNVQQAKSIVLADFLSSLGCEPIRQNGIRLVYLSPFRLETKPSFFVNLQRNTWCDFGESKKGDIIDFVRVYANVSDTSSALVWLNNHLNVNRSHLIKKDYAAPIMSATITTDFKVRPLMYNALLQYLFNRGIPSEISKRYCKEIWHSQHGKNYFYVAFPNRSGGYDGRNPYIKRCFGKKDISCIYIHSGERTKACCVFEGFIDFLSYVVFFRSGHNLAQTELCDCIVLNSVSTLQKALPELANYHSIHCYLDNDKGGKDATAEIQRIFPYSTIDESVRYDENDVNDYLMKILKLYGHK